MRTAPERREYLSSLSRGIRDRRAFAEVERYAMFVGYPRSGHSVIGSLLNAHPDMVVAHELNALRYVQAGFSRLQLFSLLLVSDRKFEAHGRTWGRYEYRVPGQWQGRWRRLRVIGDKKGGASTRRLQRSPELLEGLRATVRVPLRIVHVTRSPFDNIAAIHLMKRGRRTDATLEDAVDFYFELAEATGGLEARVPAEEWLELSHYDFVAQPREALTSLCRFMGVDPEPAYLESCAQLVHPRPRRTRETAPWTPRLVDQVRRRSREYPFLARYAEEECAHADVGA